jgi:NAD(P)-dependent dehydrogenase (short-subunit alcohol dehydrogenase family)
MGHIAIVTGGASGIGSAISQRLAADGAAVAVLDLNGEAAEAEAAKIAATGVKAIGLTVDVADRAAVDAALEQVRSQLGAPSIVVNSAGLSLHVPFMEITNEQFDRIVAINLTGTFNVCQSALPDLLAAGWGRIINISSSSVHSGAPRLAAYVAAKSGVVGLTKALAIEFAPCGITVNSIAPGAVDTPMLRRTMASGAISDKQAAAPVGRLGRPEDIAATTAFLVSEEAGYITGQLYGVNGGRNTGPS